MEKDNAPTSSLADFPQGDMSSDEYVVVLKNLVNELDEGMDLFNAKTGTLEEEVKLLKTQNEESKTKETLLTDLIPYLLSAHHFHNSKQTDTANAVLCVAIVDFKTKLAAAGIDWTPLNTKAKELAGMTKEAIIKPFAPKKPAHAPAAAASPKKRLSGRALAAAELKKRTQD